MRSLFVIFSFLSLVALAYINASSNKISRFDSKLIKLGMNEKEIIKKFGSPTSKQRNILTYIFDDSSELRISLRDNAVNSAEFKFKTPPKIEDFNLKKMTLVQMESHEFSFESPKWFYAGNPKDGMIYKISSTGEVESLTWIPPFTYGENKPKKLQALYKDFQIKQSLNL